MAAIHFPILIWPDATGGHTAVIVGDPESAAAHAGTVKEAVQQLAELLDWRRENEPWNLEPDFAKPELLEVKVEVLPQYVERKRVIPCPETIWLKVPCVTGVQENGLRVCAVPHLGLRFNYQDETGLRGLAAHYLKEALQGLSPLQLATRLPPRHCELGEIIHREPARRSRKIPPGSRSELKVLFNVADPLLHDLGRKRASSAAYGRENLSAILARKLGHEKASVLLVGAAGVGKSTLLLDAVKRLQREAAGVYAPSEPDGEQDNDLRGYRFWRGNGSRLIAGMRYLGEWEERGEDFVERLHAIEGVFCAESLLELVQVGGQDAGGSVAAFLLPYLQRGEMRMVAEATQTEVEACRRLLPGLLDVFHILPVPEFNDAEAIEILNRLANAHATAARLKIDPGVVSLTQMLFKRFMPYAVFPGLAANFVRTLCDGSGRSLLAVDGLVTGVDVVTQFIKNTGLPEIFLRDELPLATEAVRGRFDGQIIGQADATTAMARLVTTIKTGLTDPGRPFGVLLFCGPTGVGKTALAKATADFCFGAGGQKERLIRLDMSEYGGWGAARRLLQSADGSSAPWINRVRRQPFCVVLFDEIEKAAPEVFDVLLGLLDEGRLTDPFGRITNFRSAIVIMTSNLGSSSTEPIGFLPEQQPAYESEVGKFFRPEFFNRLDGVITFKALTSTEIEKITHKELNELATREGFAEAGIRLVWSDALVNLIAREGYDHRLGARPLQRTLERLVVTPLARWKVAHPAARNVVLNVELQANKMIEVFESKSSSQ
jgi:ATP-dependent Clp protease ATP-binding subunit ClpC